MAGALREFGLGVRASGEGRESQGSGGRSRRGCVQSHFRFGRAYETRLEQQQAASAHARIQHSQPSVITEHAITISRWFSGLYISLVDSDVLVSSLFRPRIYPLSSLSLFVSVGRSRGLPPSQTLAAG